MFFLFFFPVESKFYFYLQSEFYAKQKAAHDIWPFLKLAISYWLKSKEQKLHLHFT